MKTTTAQKDGHDRFGGVVYLSDFNTENRGNDTLDGSAIAGRIFSDWSFDRQCCQNEEGRDRKICKKRKACAKSTKEELENSVACHPGYYLRKVMAEKGYTQDYFAAQIGISVEELCRLLCGERDLSVSIIKKLAVLLDTTTGYWIEIQNRYNEMAGKELMNVKALV